VRLFLLSVAETAYKMGMCPMLWDATQGNWTATRSSSGMRNSSRGTNASSASSASGRTRDSRARREGPSPPMRYRNPILPGCYPDPSVCRVGDDYYLVNSSFEFFPGVPIFHSRDLVRWRQIGHCLDRPSQLPLKGVDSSCGIYAPTLRHHDGVFYMTTTNVTAGGNFIVTAQDPAGPWSDPVLVAQEGIDPSMFFDEDGSVLYTTSAGGALQSRVDVRTGKLLSEPKLIWKGTGGRYPEGPHLYRKDGWVYLLLAEGGTEHGHMVTMARSKSPWGPFEPCPRNPLLTHRSLLSPIQALGHADLVETPDGHWFAVLLANRPVGYPPTHHLGRETFLCPVRWAEDGFPIFGDDGTFGPRDGVAPPVLAARRDGAPRRLRRAAPRPRLGPLRDIAPGRASLTERPGFLRLRGSADNLDDKAAPAWVGSAPTAFLAPRRDAVEFDPASEREEAGLSVRMNERHHHEVFVTRAGRSSIVVLRQRVGDLRVETACRPGRTPRRGAWCFASTPRRRVTLSRAGPRWTTFVPSGRRNRAISRPRWRRVSSASRWPCTRRGTGPCRAPRGLRLVRGPTQGRSPIRVSGGRSCWESPAAERRPGLFVGSSHCRPKQTQVNAKALTRQPSAEGA
jgi:alpha-N-arabinofuranosidase